MEVFNLVRATIRNNGIRYFIAASFKQAVEYVMLSFFPNYVINNFSKRAELVSNRTNDLIKFAFNYRFLCVGIKPDQEVYEIRDFLNLLKKQNPKNIMEIGTNKGGTLFLFSKISDPEAKIISVDYQPTRTMQKWFERRVRLYRTFVKKGQSLHLIMADSHKQETLKRIKNLLSREKLDFLFIDGDHGYNGVKADYRMYSQFVKKGGIIAFHDVSTAPGVIKFWAELKTQIPQAQEINHVNGWGIGIITR